MRGSPGSCLKELQGSLDRLWPALEPVVSRFLGPGWLRGELEAQLRARCDPASTCLALGRLQLRLSGARVCVAGPRASFPEGCDVHAAPEGGLARALEAGVRLVYVAGDMDASLRLLYMAGHAAELYLAHLHADNWHREHPPASLVYTSQAPSASPCVLGPAGFTDGDRAVIVAMLLGAREVVLDGYWGSPSWGHKDWSGSWKPWKLEAARASLEAAARALGYRALGEPPTRYLRLHRNTGPGREPEG